MQLIARGHQGTIKADGFSVIELLIAIIITVIGAVSVMPSLFQQFKQADVDSYTNRLESGLANLKSNLLSRQTQCKIKFPTSASRTTGITPQQLEQINLDHPNDCPKPQSIQNWNGQRLDMQTTDLRLVNLKGLSSRKQNDDLRVVVTPATVEITTIGGVAAPTAGSNQQPLTLRVYSRALKQQGKGFERCLQLEVMTGAIIRGTWNPSLNLCSKTA